MIAAALLLAAGPALAADASARPASAGWADSATRPVRCHWQRREDEARCADVLAAAEAAWAAQVDGIGFSAPLPDGEEGGSEALDVYLTVDVTGGAGEAWVDCVGGDGTCLDSDPADGKAAAPAYVVVDARTDDADLAEYVVHEFNHACQYASDWAEPFLVAWEGTAVAAQTWTLGEHSAASEIADYQATPWLSAVLQDGYLLEDYGLWSWYEYGAVVWVLWMDQAHGDGAGSVGPALWAAMTQEGAGSEPDVLDAWGALAGDWRADLLAFTVDRARMGGEGGPDWLAWAGDAARAWREAEGLSEPGSWTPAWPIFPLGAAFYDVDLPAGARWSFAAEGDEGVDWAVIVVGATDAVVAEGEAATWEADAAETVTVAVVNLGPPGMDADDVLEVAEVALVATDLDAADDAGEADEDTGGESAGAGCGCASAAGGRGRGLAVVGAAIAAGLARRRSSRRDPRGAPP